MIQIASLKLFHKLKRYLLYIADNFWHFKETLDEFIYQSIALNPTIFQIILPQIDNLFDK